MRAMSTRGRPPLTGGHEAAAVPRSDGHRPDSEQGRADGRTTDGCGSLPSHHMRPKTVQNEPKLRGSCAPWQKLRG